MANLLLIDHDPDLLVEQVRHLFPSPEHEVEADCTGYDGCSLYMTSHHSCVLQTGVCLYF